MRTGFKVAAAGLVVVLGCSVGLALGPLSDTVSTPVAPVSATAQNVETGAADEQRDVLAEDAPDASAAAESAAGASAGLLAGSADVHRSAPLEPDVTENASHMPNVEAAYRDGVYRASAAGMQGDVAVTVTVSRGRIESIVVGQNAEAPAMAETAQKTVVPQIIEEQSTDDIDMATGATQTSQAIVAAVEAALARAAV